MSSNGSARELPVSNSSLQNHSQLLQDSAAVRIEKGDGRATQSRSGGPDPSSEPALRAYRSAPWFELVAALSRPRWLSH